MAGLDFTLTENLSQLDFFYFLLLLLWLLILVDSLRSKKALRSNQSNSESFDSQNESGGTNSELLEMSGF